MLMLSDVSSRLGPIIKAPVSFLLFDCVNADAHAALGLVYADRLYRGRLSPFNDYLEDFLRSLVPACTLNDI